jgi:hypothetical protein
MPDQTSLLNKLGEYVATIEFNESRWSLADRDRPARSDGVLLPE